MQPLRIPATTASVREVAPSLMKIECRWTFTVHSEIPRTLPTIRLEYPSLIPFKTCRSLGVSMETNCSPSCPDPPFSRSRSEETPPEIVRDMRGPPRDICSPCHATTIVHQDHAREPRCPQCHFVNHYTLRNHCIGKIQVDRLNVGYVTRSGCAFNQFPNLIVRQLSSERREPIRQRRAGESVVTLDKIYFTQKVLD